MFSLFFFKNKNIIVFFFLISFSVVSMTVLSPSVQKQLFTFFITISQPFTWVINEVSKSISDLQNLNVNLDRLEEFEKDYEKKKVLTDEFDLLIQENIRLQRLLDFKELSSSPALFEKSLPTEIADVIIRDPSSFYQTIIINKGIAHDIRENMPVIAFQTVKEKDQPESLKRIVIGKIVQVSYLHAKILPIIDPDCVIHVKLKGSDYTGILKGRGKYNKGLILTNIDNMAKVEIGEEVVTSGGQSIFPVGIKIGRIVEKIIDNSSYMKTLIVKPYVNFSRLDNVVIIKTEFSNDLKILLGNKEDIAMKIIQLIHNKKYQKAIQLINKLKDQKK